MKISDDKNKSYNNFKNESNPEKLQEASRIIQNFISNELSEFLIKFLPRWALKHNRRVTHTALTDLLHGFKNKMQELKLPWDSRTLLKTPRSTPVIKVSDGHYCHFGVKPCLRKIIKQRISTGILDYNLRLLVNADGVPLGNNAVNKFFPILCSEREIKKVYIIGLFCGEAEPNEPNELLKFFVDEISDIINNGFEFGGKKYSVELCNLICDSPAKSRCLCTKFPTGYDSCPVCTITGDWGSRGVCFPGGISALRTDENFKNFYYSDHQHKKSILASIPNFGCITNVPLDPMHLVDLGVCRKILHLLINPTPRIKKNECKINFVNKAKISNLLESYKECCPCDFARRPRSFVYILKYKSTEFREFSLYTGVVALHGLLEKSAYDNFIKLHVVMTILSNPKLAEKKEWLDFAENVMYDFKTGFEDIYGEDFASFNVHAILHLIYFCRMYGSVEKFSAYRFESFNYLIKLAATRKGEKPLQQVMRRFYEFECLNDEEEIKLDVDLKQEHSDGPILSCIKPNIKQFKSLKKKNLEIKLDGKNNILFIENKFVVEALNIVSENNEINIIGRKYNIISNLYTDPLPSKDLGIVVVSSQNLNILESWNIKHVTAKMFKLPYKENFVVLSIIHTFNESL